MVFNTLSPNFVMGSVLPRTQTQTRQTQIQNLSQSRERRKVVTCKFNLEAGHEKQASTLSFWSYQSQYGDTSIIQVLTSEISNLSLIPSFHPSPPVISISEMSSIECSELKYNNEQNETKSSENDEIAEVEKQTAEKKGG